ncbi:MAG: hypothetical protein K0U39_01480 [Alphaproteobacteria bacterium]|nr:hypothetical protein [Alphaproteobacteria bacterium]
MKLHIFNTILNKKLRTNTRFNILLLFFLCFFAITTLFLFIDSQQSKLPNLEQVLIECIDNHHYHAAVAWNEMPIIDKLFEKHLPALNTDADCVQLVDRITHRAVRRLSNREKNLQTATIRLSFFPHPDDAALECEPKYKYYSAVWWNNAPLLGTFFKKTLPTYDATLNCIDLTQLILQADIKEFEEKQKLLDAMEERLRIEFGYEYLHDYKDEHKGEYELY